ncbi:hypothetical protein PIB30_028603 [Stylosanthes scabra]|uniref:DUF674 family protein n=1 Tax=Stylosanthes scabra TaxID=79078 RepID=A0ABU6XA67_9FABA|nr:hypothetical protein [Stylosanthes scabra]
MGVQLKLMVNKEKNKVVFAEAGKDFVDVLFSFLTLPLGTLARLAAKEEKDLQPVKFGSISSLYSSVANLDEREYLTKKTCKEMLLQPRNSMEAYLKKMKLNIDDTNPTTYYLCKNFKSSSHHKKPFAPPCSADASDGFVKSGVVYLISDQLKVAPTSWDAMCDLVRSCNTPALEQVTVKITENQVLELLKCSLVSKTPLTDVFLLKKPSFERFEQPTPVLNRVSEGSSSKQIEVKLLRRKSDGKIVSVQGKKDFADLLHSFLTFPLGAVIKLLDVNSCMRSIDALYNSIVGLSEDYLPSKEVKDKLLSPLLAPQFKLSNQIIPIDESHVPTYYLLREPDGSYLSTRKSFTGRTLEFHVVDPIDNIGTGKGFAKGPTLYMATDVLDHHNVILEAKRSCNITMERKKYYKDSKDNSSHYLAANSATAQSEAAGFSDNIATARIIQISNWKDKIINRRWKPI